MNKASVGLLSLWTGEVSANIQHMRTMALHQMTDAEVDQFAEYVRDALGSMQAISNHIKNIQEQP